MAVLSGERRKEHRTDERVLFREMGRCHKVRKVIVGSLKTTISPIT